MHTNIYIEYFNTNYTIYIHQILLKTSYCTTLEHIIYKECKGNKKNTLCFTEVFIR